MADSFNYRGYRIKTHARGEIPFAAGGLVVALPPDAGFDRSALGSSDPAVRDAASAALVFGQCIRRNDATVIVLDLDDEVEREFSVLDVLASSPSLELWRRAMAEGEKDEADWWKGENDAGGGAADRA